MGKVKELLDKEVLEHEGEKFTIRDIIVAGIMVASMLVFIGVVGRYCR